MRGQQSPPAFPPGGALAIRGRFPEASERAGDTRAKASAFVSYAALPRGFLQRVLHASTIRDEGRLAPCLPGSGGLRLDQPLRDFLSVQTGHDPFEQPLPHADEGVALANAYVGGITLADAGRAQGLV